MKRFILLILLGFMSFPAPGQEKETGTEVRKGEVIEPEQRRSEISNSVKLVMPSGQTMEIPPDVLNNLDPDEVGSLLREQIQSQKPSGFASLLLREEILIPFIVFSTAPVIVLIVAYFAYRSRKDTQETIRLAIQSGQALPEGVMSALERRRLPSTEGDLRKAVLLCAIGIGGALILFVANPLEREVAILGLVPCILGLGYLFLWWQASKSGRRLQHERA